MIQPDFTSLLFSEDICVTQTCPIGAVQKVEQCLSLS
jgi:hypothetical protein